MPTRWRGFEQEVLDRVERDRGTARGWTKVLAERDPDILERLHDTVMHALYRRFQLATKIQTHTDGILERFQFPHGGVSGQTKAALEAGASGDEILEALEIVSLSNLHGVSTALPIVVEEFENFKNRAGEDGAVTVAVVGVFRKAYPTRRPDMP